MEEEPIAIVGIGCRLPGGCRTPDSLWQYLGDRQCAISEIPADRWRADVFYDRNPAARGQANTKWGAFVPDIAHFDPGFFGISRREAVRMDPQQRVMLQVAWEAFEDAGIAVDRLAGGDTAVFVGVSVNEFSASQRFCRTGGDMHSGTGNALSIVANRISFCFDFRGPSASIDTACSSSLVAVDAACHALRSGRSRIALAGGVNALFDPGVFINFSKANMMSPTGRVRTFDAAADGYVRGEGAGAVVLRPLADALADGNEIYALIRGTEVSQDGRTSTITVPSGAAQARMLERVLARAGTAPADIDYAEAHGTGTPVGDPIEANAIGTVLGAIERDRPVYIGSIKPNIGHLESAAGMAGLIKTALMIKRGVILPNTAFETPNPHIDFAALNIEVPIESTPWPRDGLRRATASSFGFGGTNACVLLEQAPTIETPSRERSAAQAPQLILVSAAEPQALRTLAASLADGVERDRLTLDALAASSVLHRAQLDERLAVVAASPGELLQHLRAFAREEVPRPERGRAPAVITGRRAQAARLVFAYTGQGSQWIGMGRRLIEEDPVVADAVARFDAAFREVAGWSVRAEIFAPDERSQIDQTVVTQPAITALQIGLTERWRAWGIVPDAVVGHSIGEAAAAWACGALTLEEVALLVRTRSRLQGSTEGTGAIAAVGLPVAAVETILARHAAERVGIAAVNGAAMVNLAGAAEELDVILEHIAKAHPKAFVRRLRMNYAPHSPEMEPIRAPLLAALAKLAPRPARIPFYSTVTGTAHTGLLDAEYWWRNARQAVLFKPVVDAILADGYQRFVEIGPHAALAPLVTGAAAESGQPATIVPSMLRDAREREVLLASLAQLHVHGQRPQWEAVAPAGEPRVRWPTYPWQTEPFFEHSEEERMRGFSLRDHPLLGYRERGPQPQWENEIDLGSYPELADHRINGAVIFPAAGYVEMMLAAVRVVTGSACCVLENVIFHEALALAEEAREFLRTEFAPALGRLTIHSRARDHTDWILRASAKLRSRPPVAVAAVGAPEQGADEITGGDFYRRIARSGYGYGPAFQWIERLAVAGTAATGHLRAAEPGDPSCIFRVGQLDACFQIAVDVAQGPRREATLFLPTRIEALHVHAPPTGALEVACRATSDHGTIAKHDCAARTEAGDPVLTIEGFTSRRMKLALAAKPAEETPTAYFAETWQQLELEPLPNPPRAASWLVLGSGDHGATRAIADQLRDHLRGCGCAVTLIDAHEVGADIGAHDVAVCAWPLALTEVAPGAPLVEAVAHLAPRLARLAATLEGKAQKLLLMTRGARAVGAAQPAAAGLAQAPIVGLARTIASEYRNLPCVQIDLDAADDPDVAAAIVALVAQELAETEVARRDGAWHGVRLERVAADDLPARKVSLASVGPDAAFRVQMARPGVLDTLTPMLAPLPAPAADEVVIAVRAVGLNFRDVMAATGLLPEEAEADPAWRSLGLECAGIVTAIGADVRGIAVGDRVMALTRGCLASHATARAALVMQLPPQLDFAAGATIPSAYATAYHGLVELARLERGESVLIHSATGGVGLAAIAVARSIGAEIFATAGSERKRAYLRELGIRHVMDSRSSAFATEIQRITAGRGVDVVLNSLPGELLEAGMSVVAPYGRFIEIGKRDVYADTPIGLRALRANVSLHVVDLAAAARERPAAMGRLMERMRAQFESAAFAPLPLETFPMARAADAFRHMAQAAHIGKVVVTNEDPALAVALDPTVPLHLRRDGAYLVTGGLAGLGLETARWLAARGAGHLWLISRSGTPDAAGAAAIAELRSRGTVVNVMPADVAVSEDIGRVLAAIAASGVTLRGVVHSAMVLDDGTLAQLDAERFARVLRPKVTGGWLLHEATLGLPLDLFVMYSSVAATIGSAGQGNYVAANAFLDGLAVYRRAQGLPATTIGWGAMGEVGIVQRNPQIGAYLASLGVLPVPLADAFETLDRLVRADVPPILAGRIDFERLRQSNRVLGASRRYERLALAQDAGNRMRARIAALPPQAREGALRRYLVEQVARSLRADPTTIVHDRPLAELGLDSLTSFELKNRIDADLDVTLGAGQFLQMPTIDSLTAQLLPMLESEVAAPAQAEPDQAPQLSVRQAELLRDYREHPEPNAYLRNFEHAFGLAIRPRVDPERLRATTLEVLERHAVLRTVFPTAAPPARSDAAAAFEIIDATDLDPGAFAARLEADGNVPIDVATGPLWKLTLYRRPDEDCLLLAFSELVCDGWSSSLVLDEILRRFFGAEPGASDGEVLTFADYIRWQRRFLDGPAGAAALAHWRERLPSPGRALELGFDRPRSSGGPVRAGHHAFVIEGDEARVVRDLAARHRTTAFVVCLAAFARLIAERSARTDFTITSIASGRTQPGFERAIGAFANPFVVPLELAPHSDAGALLAHVADRLRESLAHQDVPIHRVLALHAIRPGPIRGDSALDQVGFYMAAPSSVDRFGLGGMLSGSDTRPTVVGRWQLTPQPVASGGCQRDLQWTLRERGSDLYGGIKYDAALFDAATIEQMAGRYGELLRALGAGG